MKYYLAVDLGASSGRLILGSVLEGRIEIEEIHRFTNGMEKRCGHLCWNYEKLFDEICKGMRKCFEQNQIPVSMAIDTWGVDFVLLDAEGKPVGLPVGYRDGRTAGMEEELSKYIKPEPLYARTGIQKAVYNTIYQLLALQREAPEQLAAADCLLMTPQYFDYLLTGRKTCEYTVASTTQLLAPMEKTWDYELLSLLGIPEKIMRKPELPGTFIGQLSPNIAERVGFQCRVLHAASHDTASAIMSVPATADESYVYISSGTWSLMGVERKKPDLSEKSRICNFTNEGGYEYRFRYLKNIMGLWMIQSIKKEQNDRYSFAELCALAEAEREYPGRVDINDSRFLAPKSMTEEIREALREQAYPDPKNDGELAACIYQSLAESYADTIKELEILTGTRYDTIHIVGGGSHADYLNKLTEEKTGRKVIAGPSEATAIGNLLAQMIAEGEFATLTEARTCVAASGECRKQS